MRERPIFSRSATAPSVPVCSSRYDWSTAPSHPRWPHESIRRATTYESQPLSSHPSVHHGRPASTFGILSVPEKPQSRSLNPLPRASQHPFCSPGWSSRESTVHIRPHCGIRVHLPVAVADDRTRLQHRPDLAHQLLVTRYRLRTSLPRRSDIGLQRPAKPGLQCVHTRPSNSLGLPRHRQRHGRFVTGLTRPSTSEAIRPPTSPGHTPCQFCGLRACSTVTTVNNHPRSPPTGTADLHCHRVDGSLDSPVGIVEISTLQ